VSQPHALHPTLPRGHWEDPLLPELRAALDLWEHFRLLPLSRLREQVHDQAARLIHQWGLALGHGFLDHAGIRYLPTDDDSFVRNPIPRTRGL
jgi:hypothetical protein